MKVDLKCENYIVFLSNRRLRTVLSRFRCGNHNLNIEAGRWENRERMDRLCTFCLVKNGINVIEDEIHFIVDCPLYVNKRTSLMPFLNNISISSEERYLYVFKNCQFHELAQYILSCSHQREQYLERHERL